MWIRRIFWAAAIVVIAVPVAVVVGLNLFGLERFRQPIEAKLSDALGRKVELRGLIRIALDYRPTLNVQNIWIDNASWGQADALATIEKLSLEAQLLPLFQGLLIVDDVSMHGVTVNLEENDQALGNWEADPNAAAAPPAAQSDNAKNGFEIDVRNVQVEDLDLVHVDPRGMVKFDLVEAHFVKDAEGEELEGELKGVIEGFPFDVELHLPGFSTLMEGGGKSAAVLQGVFGGVDFKGDGHIDTGGEDFSYAVDLEAEAGPFEGLAPDLKHTLPSGRPFKASGKVEGGFQDLKANGLDVELAGRNASVDLNLRYPRQGRLYGGAIRSDRLNLDDLLPEPNTDATASDESDEPPDIEQIGNLDFAATLGELDGLGLPWRDLDTAFVVKDGNGQFDIHSLEIANPSWATSDLLLRLDEFSLTFPFADLLQGRLHFAEAALFQTAINLATNSEGVSNWDLLTLPDLGGGDAAGTPELWLEVVKITDFDIAYADADGTAIAGGIGGGLLRMSGFGAPLGGFVEGKVNDIAYETDIELAKLSDLFQDPPVPALSLNGNYGGLKADLKGALKAGGGNQTGPILDVEGSIEAQAPGALAPLFADVLPKARPLKSEFALSGQNELLDVKRLAVILGGSNITGSGRIDASGAKPTIKAELQSDKLLGDDLGLSRASEANDASEEDADGSIDLAFLNEVELDLSFKGDSLAIEQFDLTELEVKAVVKDGNLTLQPLGFDIGNGAVDAIISIQSTEKTYQIRQDLTVQNVPLDLVFVGTEVPDYVEAPFHLRLTNLSTGTDLEGLLKSSNGNIRLFVGEGQVQAQLLDLFVGGLRSIFGSLFSRDGGGWTKLNCAVLEGPIQNGVLTPRILYLDTAVASIAGQGDINFGAERVDLTLTPRSRGMTLNLSVPVGVSGPFDDVSVTPRPDLGTALRGLTVAASAFLFPPAAVAAFVDLGVGQRCLKASNGSQSASP